jgi:hypothetical protein
VKFVSLIDFRYCPLVSKCWQTSALGHKGSSGFLRFLFGLSLGHGAWTLVRQAFLPDLGLRYSPNYHQSISFFLICLSKILRRRNDWKMNPELPETFAPRFAPLISASLFFQFPPDRTSSLICALFGGIDTSRRFNLHFRALMPLLA